MLDNWFCMLFFQVNIYFFLFFLLNVNSFFFCIHDLKYISKGVNKKLKLNIKFQTS